ncbi:MAG: sulfite exporter TauE/SafE family protein [Rhizobiaceae bacterium]
MELLAALLPDGITPAVALFLVAASAVTSALTASFGIGGGIAMLALLGIWLPVNALIPVHGAVQLGSNTGRAWRQRAFVRRDVILPFLCGGVVGAGVAAFIVVDLPESAMKVVLGLFLLFAVWVRIPALERLSRSALGMASAGVSVLSMLVGATGPVVVALLSRMIAGDRKALVATTAVAMTIQHLLKIVVFGVAGFAFAQWVPLVLAMIGSGYAGTVYGSALLDRMPEAAFARWFNVLISLLAADLVRRGLTQMF